MHREAEPPVRGSLTIGEAATDCPEPGRDVQRERAGLLLEPGAIRDRRLRVEHHDEVEVAQGICPALCVASGDEHGDRTLLDCGHPVDDALADARVESVDHLDCAIQVPRSSRSASVIPVALPGGIASVSTACRSMSSIRARISSRVLRRTPSGAAVPE